MRSDKSLPDENEPSGLSGKIPVDPDRAEEMMNPNKTKRYPKKAEQEQNDRSKILKKEWQVKRNRGAEPLPTVATMGDNADLTGSGQGSVVNGPIK